jgi:WhiB family redox-sensing transcriptional regulator
MGPEIFFPPKSTVEAEAEAKRICVGCPVRMPCLDMAIDEGLAGGVFGGANDDERARIARRLQRRVWMISSGAVHQVHRMHRPLAVGDAVDRGA